MQMLKYVLMSFHGYIRLFIQWLCYWLYNYKFIRIKPHADYKINIFYRVFYQKENSMYKKLKSIKTVYTRKLLCTLLLCYVKCVFTVFHLFSLQIFAVQHVDVCMFSNGKFKNIVAELDDVSKQIGPNDTLHGVYSLLPVRGR